MSNRADVYIHIYNMPVFVLQ